MTLQLGEALISENFPLPPECADIELITMPVDGVFQMRYTVILRDEDLVKLGRALQRVGAAGGPSGPTSSESWDQ